MFPRIAGWHRYSTMVVAALLGAYVGAYYLLPRGWTGGWPPGKGLSWSDVAHNTFFYPMRWMTERTTTREWDVSVGRVDLEHRTLLLMLTPGFGHVVPFRRRDEAAVRTLRLGDRIRVRIVNLPEVQTRNIHWEFRDFVRLEGEVVDETLGERVFVP